MRDQQAEIGGVPRIARGEPQKAAGAAVSPQDSLANGAVVQMGLHGLRVRSGCLAIRVGGDPFSQISALFTARSRPVHDDATTPMRVKSVPAARSGQVKCEISHTLVKWPLTRYWLVNSSKLDAVAARRSIWVSQVSSSWAA